MVGVRRNRTWIAPLLVLGALALPPGAAGAATPSWRAQPMVGPPDTGAYFIDGVSCSAANACTAVGAAESTVDSPANTSLAQRWDGTSWTVQAVPTPPGATDAALTRVSCPTATTCIAAGNEQGPTSRVYALMWDGSSWSPMTLPPLIASSGNAAVQGIDCVSATWCKLAGYVLGTAGQLVPFVVTWNGTSWTADTVPLPAAATHGTFTAIDCYSTTACAAVGSFGNPSISAEGRAPALAETWNGKTWHVDSAADPGSLTLPDAVACPASGSCFAVGWYRTSAGHSAPLIEKKAGSLWLNQTAPKPKTGTDFGLLGISCTSASNCETVGYAQGAGVNPFGYAAAFSGLGGWTVETLPVRDYLQGVSCPVRTFCLGVGVELNSGDPMSAIRS